jgi:hypothetical protein
MNELRQFINIVRHCNHTYRRSKNSYENLFWRTPAEIEQAKSIFYLCCTERTLMIAQNALKAGLENQLVLYRVKGRIQQPKPGTALELILNGHKYRFYSNNSGDRLAHGEVKGGKKRTHVQRVETVIDNDKNYFAHFGINSVEELEAAIPGLNYEKFLKRVLRKGSTFNYNFKMKQVRRGRIY